MSHKTKRRNRNVAKQRITRIIKRELSVPHGSQLKRKRIRDWSRRQKLLAAGTRHMLRLQSQAINGVIATERGTGRKVTLVHKNPYRAAILDKGIEHMLKLAATIR